MIPAKQRPIRMESSRGATSFVLRDVIFEKNILDIMDIIMTFHKSHKVILSIRSSTFIVFAAWVF
jgi:hypothetical protein